MSLKLSEACCTLPVVESEYKPKGSRSQRYDGLETYTVGDNDSKTAIIAVYDIFGSGINQTLQGVDIVASTLKAKVVMPDFFEGSPWPADKHPPQNDEDKAAFGKFFETTGNAKKITERMAKIAEQLRSEGVEKIGAYGLCLGGKVVTLVGSNPGNIQAVASLHPAMVDPKDGDGLKIPLAVFASKDEPADAVAELEKKVMSNSSIADKSVFMTYSTQRHGWAGARGDMKDEECKKQYISVYSNVVSFFQQTL